MKKGVFGNKEKPLDAMRGVEVKAPPMPKRMVIKEAKNGGYIVSMEGGDKNAYGDDHIAKTNEELMSFIEKHFDCKDSDQE